jgi:hypothetical protein
MHVVKWVEPSSDQDEHHLFLRDVRVGRERELLTFPRHVEVFWSPSGTRLAVTNGWASDESTVLLWTDLSAPPVDLLDELAAQEGQQVAGWDAHHLYLGSSIEQELAPFDREMTEFVRAHGPAGQAQLAVKRRRVRTGRRNSGRSVPDRPELPEGNAAIGYCAQTVRFELPLL